MKTKRTLGSMLSLAMATGIASSALWSADSHAGCSYEPTLSSICVMARYNTTAFAGFVLADGASLPVQQNTPLYSLLGSTFGGNGSTSFNLPDLRGRVPVGPNITNSALVVGAVGAKGGANTVTLTAAQMPAHTHAVSNNAANTGKLVLTWLPGTLQGSTPASSFTASTAALTGLTGTVNGSDLTLKASALAATSPNPTGNALSVPATNAIYTSAAPSVQLANGSITGSLTVNLSGALSTTFSGSTNVTVSGTGSLGLSGATDATGSAQAFSVMPPYLAMPYYIATTGLYPMRD